MKKSKVLIPAMALLLFSTAASITGTVAWFTSTRSFNTSAGSFKVAKLDGSLSCDMTALVGTVIANDGTDHETVSVQSTTQGHDIQMGDASFDHNTHTLYTDNPSTGGFTNLDAMTGSDGDYAATNAAKWLYNTVGTHEYYFAVAWKMEFSYEFIAESKNVNVFFDYKASTLNKTSGDAHASTNDTQKGFRIAFLGAGGTIIWSEKYDGNAKEWDADANDGAGGWEAAADYKGYVNGTAVGATTAYVAADNFIGATEKAAEYTRVVDGGATTGRKDYLGTITKPANPGSESITVTCVAWFDGTSKNVVDSTSMAVMSASMQFYATMAA